MTGRPLGRGWLALPGFAAAYLIFHIVAALARALP